MRRLVRAGAGDPGRWLWHFDINDGYRLKHDVDIAVGLVNPLDWLNVLVLLRSSDYNGPFQPRLQTAAHHE